MQQVIFKHLSCPYFGRKGRALNSTPAHCPPLIILKLLFLQTSRRHLHNYALLVLSLLFLFIYLSCAYKSGRGTSYLSDVSSSITKSKLSPVFALKLPCGPYSVEKKGQHIKLWAYTKTASPPPPPNDYKK